MSALTGIVLAAGAGSRLRPLTELLPKPLCPVANRPLLGHALERVRPHVSDVAVNVHHHRDVLLAHLADSDVHVSVEAEPLGTAGAVGNLRGWIDGAPVLVANGDVYGVRSLDRLVEGWDGTTVRLLVSYRPDAPDFRGVWRFAGVSLLPAAEAAALPATPAGLYETCWREAAARGALELVPADELSLDCGTPAGYLAANLAAVGPRGRVADGAEITGAATGSAIGEGAVVAGRVRRCVVWPDAEVAADEDLTEVIRLPDGRTVAPFTA